MLINIYLNHKSIIKRHKQRRISNRAAPFRCYLSSKHHSQQSDVILFFSIFIAIINKEIFLYLSWCCASQKFQMNHFNGKKNMFQISSFTCFLELPKNKLRVHRSIEFRYSPNNNQYNFVSVTTVLFAYETKISTIFLVLHHNGTMYAISVCTVCAVWNTCSRTSFKSFE